MFVIFQTPKITLKQGTHIFSKGIWNLFALKIKSANVSALTIKKNIEHMALS